MFWEIVFAAEEEAESSYLLDFFGTFILWIVAIGVFVLFIILAAIIKNIVVNRVMAREKYEVHEEIVVLLGRAVYFSVILTGAVVAFHIVGINFGAILGFLAVGIGFAFKDLLANIIAGVVILTQKKLKIGDLIKINDRIGKITEIDVRTTYLKSLDGTLLVIPNAQLLANIIQNFTANEFRRVSLQVGVHYDTPLEKIISLTLASVKKNESVLQDPETQVLAKEFSDSSIMLEIWFWVESATNWPNVQSELIQQINSDYKKAGVVIPYPIRALTVDGFDRRLTETLRGGKR